MIALALDSEGSVSTNNTFSLVRHPKDISFDLFLCQNCLRLGIQRLLSIRAWPPERPAITNDRAPICRRENDPPSETHLLRSCQFGQFNSQLLASS